MNTAILILLINANFEQLKILGLVTYFNGAYPDLTYQWYSDTGKGLIFTMLINVLSPLLTFFINYFMLQYYRCKDKGCCKGKYHTKQKTIQKYVDLYAGPDYFIYNKYTSILNVIFVTFMYGLAMPLLFPICFLFLMVFYFFDKLLITYFFKKPPMYDDKINRNVISILKWPPVFMVCFGFWVMGNK